MTKKPTARSVRAIKNLDDLAKLTGFSKATVSRAMAGSHLISEETRTKVRKAAELHGFHVNRNARRLTGRTNTIAIALDFAALEGRRLTDAFHLELLADVAKALAVRDMEVLLCSPKVDEERSHAALVASRAVDGIIFLGQGSRLEYLKSLGRTGLPFVVWGAVQPGDTYCTVGTDNLLGGKLAGRRLAQLGRKRVLSLSAPGHIEMEMRRDGLEIGLREGADGIELIDIDVPDLTYDSALAALRKFLKHGECKFDAVFATSDTKALAAYTALREQNLRIPDDVSIVGYDDIPVASYLTPALTTIRQNTGQGGAILVEKLMQAIEGAKPKSALLPTELIVRGS